MGPLLTVQNLSLSFGKPVLQSVSFEVAPGGLLLILGPSGSGKSTLLRCLNRLQAPDSGAVLLNDRDTREIDVRHLRRRVGMVFQVPALLPGTVEHNMIQGPALAGKTAPRQDIEHLLTGVGLARDMLTRNAATLSIGEQQRVAFAQALANQPDVLLLDEPTSALDPTAVLTLEKLILKVNREMNRAVVMVTHNIEQALRFNTETLVLLDGRIIAKGPVQDLINNRTDTTLRSFFEGRLNHEGNGDGI